MTEASDRPYVCALRLLGTREYCRAQLDLKLRRSFDKAVVAQALDRLERDGSLCDLRFAEAYVRQRMQGGFGPNKVRHQLLQKGVSADVAERVIGMEQWRWDELVQAVARKNWSLRSSEAYRLSQEDSREMLLAKVSQFLRQRGFTMGQIENARAFLRETDLH